MTNPSRNREYVVRLLEEANVPFGHAILASIRLTEALYGKTSAKEQVEHIAHLKTLIPCLDARVEPHKLTLVVNGEEHVLARS